MNLDDEQGVNLDDENQMSVVEAKLAPTHNEDLIISENDDER